MKKVGVAGGKGGTGKSTVSLSLTMYTEKSALLDLDLTMPNIQTAINGEVLLEDGVIQPVRAGGREYFSIGYLCDKSDILTWSSEQINVLIDEIFKTVKWHDLEYLFIDCPPGTDAIFQGIISKLDTMIIVTQPSKFAYVDAIKVIELLREEEVGISGEIRNFAYFTCHECGYRHKIFDDGDYLSLNIPLLCEIPIVKLNNGIIPKKYFPLEKIIEAIENPIIEKRKRREAIRRLFGYDTKRTN